MNASMHVRMSSQRPSPSAQVDIVRQQANKKLALARGKIIAANLRLTEADEENQKLVVAQTEASTKFERLRVLFQANKLELDVKTQAVDRLEHELRTVKDKLANHMKICVPSNSAAANLKGLLSVLFDSQKIHVLHVPPAMKPEVSRARTLWSLIYPMHQLTVTAEKGHAYGETSFGTMAKICNLISQELARMKKPVRSDDVFLDWGAGSGKWLVFVSYFLKVDVTCIGVECDSIVYEVCKQNLEKAQMLHCATNSRVVQAYAQSFSCFCPVRIFYNYDGGFQKMQATAKGQIHPTIMRAAFCSPSIDVIISSRTSLSMFAQYFCGDFYLLGDSRWKAVSLPGQSMGGSAYCVTVWFRLSPMSEPCAFFVDTRFEAILADLRRGCCFFFSGGQLTKHEK